MMRGRRVTSGGTINDVKIYRALLSQSGTNNPVVTVLENTLGGDIVWIRDGLGTYRGTLTGAFTQDKTYIMMNTLGWDWQVDQNLYWSTVNYLTLATTNRVDAYTDDVLHNNRSSIEIRIYS